MGILKDRDAQFMLLAGFIIAIGLVITTVVLNSIVFEKNMAVDEGSGLLTNDIVNLMQISIDEIRNAYTDSTAPEKDQNLKFSNFTYHMQNFASNLSKIYALHGEGVNVTWDIEKWRNGEHANFTDNGMPGGKAVWSMADGVNASSVDIFKFWNMTVVGEGFKIEARDSSGLAIWSVEFNSSGYYMTNTTNTSYGSYGSDIDLNSPPYYFRQSITAPVSIHIINGSNACGSFRIQGIANGRTFYRERHYIINSTIRFSTSRVRANITIPVSVPG